MKRIFDIAVSSLGLLTMGPVLILLAILIKMEDGGPVFYRGERVGRHGTEFRIFKFRTMVVHADRLGGPSASDNDPRITRIGRTLRRYKLDELPQLINVLKGEMSLVGPRPEVRHYTDQFTEEEQAILSVRPGITDWASIWNADEGALLAGTENPEQVYAMQIRPTKLRLQMKYVRERSFLTDVKILFLTALAVVRPGSRAIEDLRRELPATAGGDMKHGVRR